MTQNTSNPTMGLFALLLIMVLTYAANLLLVATLGLMRMANRVARGRSQMTILQKPSAEIIILSKERMKNGSGLKRSTNPKDAAHTAIGNGD